MSPDDLADTGPASPPASDVAFTEAVKAAQERLGSRAAMARAATSRPWKTTVSDDLRDFLAVVDTFFLATSSADGRPYVQHRGGPPGLLKVLDERTLAFADFGGNRQYITVGNLSENDRALIFVLHFASRQRVKLWGRARVADDDPALLQSLVEPGYKARVERAIVFTLEAWDSNCQSHIAERYTEAEIAPAIDKLAQEIKRRDERIEQLEAEVAVLREKLRTQAGR
jgi:predicted pyridoxine 5'-phosphate oxidase superfamily flavin-nucleotide-binding protein